ncbi:MAG: hypothetical protein ABSB11_06480 [Sedimentisphaerales bacterium]|jgi:hypothetical protein
MKAIELKANFKPLQKALKQVALLAMLPQTPPKFIAQLLHIFSRALIEGNCFSNHLCSVNSYATRGTRESWVVFNPSKRLNELVAAMRAANRKRGIVRKRRLSHCLTP